MNTIENHKLTFLEFVESEACSVLSDDQYELEYQGLHIKDKIRYLAKNGVNLVPLANLNGIHI